MKEEEGTEAADWIVRDKPTIGFDDIAVARWCAPPLTTVRQPFAEMGEAAAQILLSLAAGNAPVQNRVELGTTLVVRDSTAPPPPGGCAATPGPTPIA